MQVDFEKKSIFFLFRLHLTKIDWKMCNSKGSKQIQKVLNSLKMQKISPLEFQGIADMLYRFL